MSKLIFPKHGGVLVDDDTRVVKTAKVVVKGRSYTIKVVQYHPDRNPAHVNAGRPFGYHYLDPDGGVTGSSSGNSHTVEQCLQKAIKSIKDADTAKRKAARTSSQKERARYKANVAFFKKNAGDDAEALARAEHLADEQGWTVEWVHDQEPYDLGDAEEAPPDEVFVAILKDNQGNVLSSLGGIGDPSDAYMRVIEAELAHEAL